MLSGLYCPKIPKETDLFTSHGMNRTPGDHNPGKKRDWKSQVQYSSNGTYIRMHSGIRGN